MEVLCYHVNYPSNFMTRGEIFVKESEYQLLKEGFTFMELIISRCINLYKPSSENTSAYTNRYIYICIYIFKFLYP